MSSMASMNVFDWARTQKRVTNKILRDRFDIDEDEADEIYKQLKEAGIIGYGGYVQEASE
jgi:bacterioferritin (cytochrome b1)